MKKLRKITLLLVMLAFVFNTICVPAMAETFVDIEDNSHEQDINLLYDLGVVNGKTDTEFEPEATLTRAEYTTILLRLLGLDGTSGENSSFVDVPESHWAHASINLAYDLGYVNGVGNSMFAPDAAIKVSEVIKMMICALGWELRAESAGGYPDGYVSTALELDMLDGISITANGEITRGEMATLVANSLEVEMYSHPQYDYGVNEGKTLLDYMDITKYEGQITANHMTTISELSGITEKGRVAMGSLLFDCGNTNASMLLGRNVVIYAKNSNIIDGTILSIETKGLSEQLIVQASKIQPGTTVNKFIYREAMTGKKNNVSIKSGAKLVCNGVEVAPWGESDLKPEYGSVTLIMNDGTNADVIIVNKYKNYLVNAVDLEDNTIYLMQNEFNKGKLVLNGNSSAVGFEIIDYNGSPINLKDLRKWDVLSVSESDDGKTVHIIRTALKIDGRITATSDDIVYVDDIDYEVYNHITEVPELGDEGSFYLDYHGNIAHFEKGDVPGEKYGWLVDMYIEGRMLKLQLFTEDGEMLTFEATKKITLDENPCNTMEMYEDKSGVLFESDAIKPQLIKFRLNSAGNLTEIDTAAGYETDYYNESRYDEFSRDLYIDADSKANGEGVIYSAGSLGSFGSRYLIRPSTKIFSIPSTGNEEDYTLISNKSLVHNGGYTNVTLYDTDEDSVVSVMVWQRIGALDATPADEMAQALVIDTKFMRDEDDNFKYTLICLNTKGNQLELSLEEGSQAYALKALTNLEKDEALWNSEEDGYPTEPADRVDVSVVNPGDIIQYQIVEDKVTCVNILFRGETPGEYDHTWSSYNGSVTVGRELYDRGSVYTGYGEVTSVSQYAAKVKVNKKDDASVTFERAFVMDAVKPILYDFETGEAKQITYEMIFPGDKIVSTREQRYQRFVVVYRNTPDIPISPNLPEIQPGEPISESRITGEKITSAVAVAASGPAGTTYENATDGDIETKWQSNRITNPDTEPGWIIVDLCGVTTVTAIGLNMTSGTREYPFWIEIAGSDGEFSALAGSASEPLDNTRTDEMAFYSLGEQTDVRYIKYLGKGPSSGAGAGYVQIDEIEIYGTPVPDEDLQAPNDPTATPDDGGGSTTPNVGDIVTTPTGTQLAQSSMSATDESEVVTAAATNSAGYSLDGDSSTYWESNSGGSKDKKGVLIFDLGETKTISEIQLEWANGSRQYNFCIQVSTDGETWSYIDNMGTADSISTMIKSNAKTACYYLGNIEARFIRYIGYANNANKYNQLCEFNVYYLTD